MKMTATTTSLSRYFLLLVVTAVGVRGEIRAFSGLIEAASTFIHFSEGWLIAPGYVDISGLVFETLDDPGDIIPNEDFPDDVPIDGDHEDGPDDDTTGDQEGDSDGGGRHLHDKPTGTQVDIVFFHEPRNCSSNKNGCDWTELGVGAKRLEEDGKVGLRWCCSNDAIDDGYCDGGSKYGQLILNATLFKGQHRIIPVPPRGKLSKSVNYGKFEVPKDSGKYVMVIANCNDEGRDVLVDGEYTWKSKHGYLPGDLFGEMYFFVVLTLMYLIILAWYGVSMRMYEDAQIPIQKWIFLTILMGLMESFFRTGDYFVWNEDGTRFWFAMYTGLVLGVLKRGISRCLIVMVSLGWGVVRDTVGSQFTKVVILGILYCGFAATRDIMTVFAIAENEVLSIDEEKELVDTVTSLTFVVAAIDVTFCMWILDSLNGTIQYLENMSQNNKLKRYLKLRCILLISILLAVIWSVFGVVSSTTEDAMVQQEAEWAVNAVMELNYLFGAVNAVMELNYLFVLTTVAFLWRPSPDAKEYAYVMEIPSLGANENGEIELELSGTVPSAMDDDDDAEPDGLERDNGKNGFRDDPDDLKLYAADQSMM